MASGTSGTGWSDLVVKLNDYFTDTKRGGFADKFKEKHGSKGEGDASGKRPYKFGQFVDRFVDRFEDLFEDRFVGLFFC